MFDLRYFQADGIDAFDEYVSKIENHGKNPLIVIPTAGGKALVSAKITLNVYKYPGTRILNITHTKDIIEQNYNELYEYADGQLLDAGIYSAGLKKRDVYNRIIFAGIQSVYKKAMHLGFFDLIICDEAHMINHKAVGMYRKFFDKMREINPKIMILGLTATPYRLKGGMLTDGKTPLFDDIIYEAKMPELMDANHPNNRDGKQYLCTLISPKKAMKAHVDLTNVHVLAGEYNRKEMEQAYDVPELVVSSVKEALEYIESYDRKKILWFTAGIEHCEHVHQTIQSFNQSVGIVHSNRMDIENDIDKARFRSGEIKHLVNVNALTTGYNVKDIDCIVVLRSTQSPGLWVQVCGRGLRLHPNKENCLVLDFGQNINRLGPIDKIKVKPPTEGGGMDTAPMKECPECQSLVYACVMKCPDCGYEWPEKPKHEDNASEQSVVSEYKKPVTYEVKDVYFSKHQKKGKPPSLRADFFTDLYNSFPIWICVEHEGFAKRKATQILSKFTVDQFDTVDEALKYADNFKKPTHIIVDENDEFPKIIGYIFKTDEMPESEKEKRERETDEALLNLI